MKPLGLILVLSIVGAAGVWAQKAPAFSAHLSQDSVLLGHYLKVSFTLEHADGRSFVSPDFGPEIEVLSGPNSSSSFSMINGESTQKTTYHYLIRPTTTGSFTIQPARIEADGKELSTLPVEFRVYPNPNELPQPPVEETDDFFKMDLGDMFQGFPFSRPMPQDTLKKKRKTVKI